MSFVDMSPVDRTDECRFVDVAVDVPRPGFFTYQWLLSELPALGARVIVPWGAARRVGVVWQVHDRLPSTIDLHKLKPVLGVLNELAVMPLEWRKLIEFASTYYHYPIGPTVHDALPKLLKTLGTKGSGVVTVRRLAEKLRSEPIEHATLGAVAPESIAANAMADHALM
jgi:primosomal protein N'